MEDSDEPHNDVTDFYLYPVYNGKFVFENDVYNEAIPKGVIEDVEDLSDSAISTDEKNKNTTLNDTLETARLSAHLDRVLTREFSLQLAYLINYQTEINQRTKKSSAKAATDTEIKNLTNIKNNYDNFNTKAV